MERLDTLISNAELYDGSGNKPYITNIGIKDDLISYIGNDTPEADHTIDATGLALSPGFIDPHASTGFGYFFPKAADHKLYQGITTEIFGNCGTSPAPIDKALIPTMERLSEDIGFPFEWETIAEYYSKLEEIGLQFNIASLTGHSTLRGGVLEDWKNVKAEEAEKMRENMHQSMRDGALGLSTGLIYAPGCFADTDEIIELAKISAAYGGLYASHIRDERDKIEEAVEEALEIGKAAGSNILISHLKAAEKQNWGKIPAILKRLESFNASEKLDVKIDVYPYTAVSTKMRAFIPKYLLNEGIDKLPERLQSEDVKKEIADYIVQRDYDMDQMIIISKHNPSWKGKSVAAISKAEGCTIADTVCELLKTDTEMWIVYHCISPEDMDAAACWEHAMVCTDSWSYPINAPVTIGEPHPRSYGAFTTFIERYVIDKKVLSFEEAVRKMTSIPAQFFGVKKRGEIKTGFFADLVLLNKSEIKANASYTDPRRLSSGVVYLWINGKLTIEKGTINNQKAGRVIRHERN